MAQNRLATTTAGSNFGELLTAKLNGETPKGDSLVKMRIVDVDGNVADLTITLLNLEWVVKTLKERENG